MKLFENSAKFIYSKKKNDFREVTQLFFKKC